MKKKVLMLWILCVCFSLSNLTSCKTVEPIQKPRIVDTTPSWDGNEQNSGVLGYTGERGFHLTKHAAERYRALTEKFGSTFLPKLKSGEGLEEQKDGTYYLSKEYIVKFILLNDMKKKF